MLAATEAHTPGPARSAGPSRGSRRPLAFASTDALGDRQLTGAPLRWPRPSRLATPLLAPGSKAARGLQALGLNTVGDLLEHLPSDRRHARTVATLRAGEQATIAVDVRTISSRRVRRRGMRPLVEATVADDSGATRATFFNQPWLAQRYAPGTRLLLHGTPDGRGGFRVSHHAIRGEGTVGERPGLDRAAGGGAVAHYPAAEGVSSTQIVTLVRGISDALADVIEALPAAVRSREALPDRASALAAMHFGCDGGEAELGRERLAFEELLLAQLMFLRRRALRSERSVAPALSEPPSLSERWLDTALPFSLTGDQRAAIDQIATDLARPRAMQRLLIGEVGSGKTVVALHAMLRAVEHGRQAALMAPTETLAEQHFATVQQLLGGEPVSVALLTGSTPARRRADVLGKLSSGELSLIVGTHALIEPDVEFRSLAVTVVDEQHRFGVRQRAALDAKGAPHALHMTATPIPRTFALAGYGDLDASTLRELPRERQPVSTRAVAGARARERAYEELREHLRAGRQAYVVCPLIDEREQEQSGEADGAGEPGVGVRAATAELRRLHEGELAGFSLVLLHGGMSPREKREAMAAFASGSADVLVATTVIEVGIDVPNATVMLVENAERFGLSQLHQLRGRIGRGADRAVCLLMGPPRSTRLRAMVEHSDGFRLAEIDLELRKEGELVGTRQSGFGHFRIASLPQDAGLLERARALAETILARDPDLSAAEHALLGDALQRRFGAEALEPIPA